MSYVGPALQNLKQFAGRLVTGIDPTKDKDYDDFREILALNDKVLQETSDEMSDEDIKKYDLDPPRVVVVGLTSAGKSSLLERVVGFPIFPVLSGVCTRQPFQLSMKRLKAGEKLVPEGSSGDSKEKSIEPEGVLRFPATGKKFELPRENASVRAEIASLQRSDEKRVEFSKKEIRATVHSARNETFTFTDLPGVFCVSDHIMGSDYQKSRAENSRLQSETMGITKHYVQKANTIVLVVISSTDWLHSMNNDPLCGYLAEWLEETRKTKEVDVYGVITKLDMQSSIPEGSPILKVLKGQLSQQHLLHGLKVKKWIPVVSSPAVLNQTEKKIADNIEREAVINALRSKMSSSALEEVSIGRDALLRELRMALLKAITKTQKGLRQRIIMFAKDVEQRLRKLPRELTVHEKRQKFDQLLNGFHNELKKLVGPRDSDVRNKLRMDLMVRAPADFRNDMKSCSLRGNITEDVQKIVDQAALDVGGGFDSDKTFNVLSKNILDSYNEPCLKLIERCATAVNSALLLSVDKAFGEYKQLKSLIQKTIGYVPNGDVKVFMESGSDALDNLEGDEEKKGMLATMIRSATAKVSALIDAHKTMICFHPMWRNFDTLYSKILLQDEKSYSGYIGGSSSNSPDDVLQKMLDLPALAKRVREEGVNAINTYEAKKGKLPANIKEKVRKHFARVEVMGYIIRMSLVGSVFPIVIRDLRDGLFEGIKCGLKAWDLPVVQLLRTRLLFDSRNEAKVLKCMNPSQEDAENRAKWTRKLNVLRDLQKEFEKRRKTLRELERRFSQQQ
mmetsp:Transcript_11741/g.17502  ORF Transcript_11741/g.17502 Transcript_11741/m.17502 type:complete len:790 (+) Transcript_11741:54-2423(+)|eukprot:CAMPEP_0167763692 /NCGR_PEP_ID=MMETSP0110_2-20121227/13538_1 /TAXON_ID=629695 /ORGANISM="Gymnochlora sp., Strain CCMP2014" /LENGTH=789 /DNA_ID=CAMNT_0007650853 /DNA_START=38 /DNA_END=2407 /DNA_ORIENTATION=-